LVALVLVGTALAALSTLPMSYLPKVLTENLDNYPFLMGYLGFVLAVFVASWGLSVAMSYASELLSETVVRTLRRDLFSNLERLSMLAVYARGPGEFVQQLDRDVMAVRGLLGNTLLKSGMEIALGLTTLGALLHENAPLTLVLLALFLLMTGAIRGI